MSQSQNVNRRILLNARPVGAPTASDFRLVHGPVPEPEIGQLLLRALYLSLDPGMRGRMSDGPSHAPPVALGEVMVGQTVSKVEASRHPDFRVGDLVLGPMGWQDYALSDGAGLTPLRRGDPHPSHALGVMGMTGFAAYMGLLDIGRPARHRRLLRKRGGRRVRCCAAPAQCPGPRARVRPDLDLQPDRAARWTRPAQPVDAHLAAQAHPHAGCPRRSKSEPLCRSNIEPGLVSDQRLVSCG
jgi:hypothetical protein